MRLINKYLLNYMLIIITYFFIYLNLILYQFISTEGLNLFFYNNSAFNSMRLFKVVYYNL